MIRYAELAMYNVLLKRRFFAGWQGEKKNKGAELLA
jgi:hypothetical protein